MKLYTIIINIPKNILFSIIRHPKIGQGPDQRIRFSLILRGLGKVNRAQILDLGCGGGFLGRLLETAGNRVVYADLSEEWLKYVKKKWNDVGYRVWCNGTKLPFKNGSFDYIVSADVLEHVHPEKRVDFIREIARCSRKGVGISFSSFSPRSPTIRFFKMMFRFLNVSLYPFWATIPEHVNFNPPDIRDVESRFNQLGFKVKSRKAYQGNLNIFIFGLVCSLNSKFQRFFPYTQYLVFALTLLLHLVVKEFDMPPYASWCLTLSRMQVSDF